MELPGGMGCAVITGGLASRPKTRCSDSRCCREGEGGKEIPRDWPRVESSPGRSIRSVEFSTSQAPDREALVLGGEEARVMLRFRRQQSMWWKALVRLLRIGVELDCL